MANMISVNDRLARGQLHRLVRRWASSGGDVFAFGIRTCAFKWRRFWRLRSLELRMLLLQRRMRRCEILMFGKQGRAALVKSGKLSLGIAQLRAVCDERVDVSDKFKNCHDVVCLVDGDS